MFLRRFFSRSLPALDWIQVGVTSHCNAACVYCPCTVYRNRWQGHHLSLQTFKKILPFCSTTTLLHLQGWGEPFLNPDFFEMIYLAKKKGCRVSTTTNGILTDKDTMARIIDLDVDVIAFSLAGTDSSNDEIRKGTHLEQVLKSIACLNRLKHTRKVLKPEIHIAYMLLRSGLKNIERLPALMQDLDISQVVISTLDFIADVRLAEVSFVSNHQALSDLPAHLDSIVADGRTRGVEIHYQIPGAEQHPLCAENVLKSLVVSSDGNVSPCVFTNMPLINSNSVSEEHATSYMPLRLGNIHTSSLDQIWWQKRAKTLRRAFAQRQYLPPCIDCSKRRIITDQASLKLPADSDILNLPE